MTTLLEPEPTITRLTYSYHDGGRAESGRRGHAGDCVTRALAIAAGLDYAYAYSEVAERCNAAGLPKSARNGVPNQITRKLFADFDFLWIPTMRVGYGTEYHLAEDLFTHRYLHDMSFYPNIVCKLSKHVTALTPTSDRCYTIRDTYDPSRNGTRAVYGFWIGPGS